ncbi:MAG: PLDc N-terminal domain-containing protein [Leptospiraceae bacterium]|nr:PLDc N-terminal domain-containing protein [Leptospiraceae bacterium]
MMTNLLSIVAIIAAVWVIYDVFMVKKNMSLGEKILWTVCAIFFSIITAIVYYFLKKK